MYPVSPGATTAFVRLRVCHCDGVSVARGDAWADDIDFRDRVLAIATHSRGLMGTATCGFADAQDWARAYGGHLLRLCRRYRSSAADTEVPVASAKYPTLRTTSA